MLVWLRGSVFHIVTRLPSRMRCYFGEAMTQLLAPRKRSAAPIMLAYSETRQGARRGVRRVSPRLQPTPKLGVTRTKLDSPRAPARTRQATPNVFLWEASEHRTKRCCTRRA